MVDTSSLINKYQSICNGSYFPSSPQINTTPTLPATPPANVSIFS